MSRRQVLESHTSRELTEWMVFDLAFGLGHLADQQAGVIAAAIWNANGGLPVEGGRPRAAVPEDFFPALVEASGEPVPLAHDADAGADAELDDEDEAERITRAMKNAWAAWGLQYNAAVRAAEKLDLDDPPDKPDLN